MIDQPTIDRILDAANIVDVVSEFVTLRKRGVNYVGLCPFHDDKTPSFYVSPSKNICKCFACGEGGTAVHFIMKHEQLGYFDALRYLAKKYNIEIQERELTDKEKQAIAGLDTTDAMTVTLGSNLNNETAGSLYPGARGKIAFTVTPLVSDLNGVTINLSRVLKVTSVGVGVVEDGGTLTAEAETLLGLVKGHLLFFTGCENGYYSGRVVDGKIEIPKSAFCEDGKTTNPTNKSVPITLYWVWPEYFQNFVLTGNTNYYKNLFASAGDEKSDYGALQADMNTHKANYFYGTASGKSAAEAPAVSADMSSSDTAICSALYNNADEQIGDKVEYIQLRMSAQEGVSS